MRETGSGTMYEWMCVCARVDVDRFVTVLRANTIEFQTDNVTLTDQVTLTDNTVHPLFVNMYKKVTRNEATLCRNTQTVCALTANVYIKKSQGTRPLYANAMLHRNR